MAEAVDRVTSALAGRYEIQREIGRGGMATVYLARDLRHSRLVAIKVLKEELSQGVAADRFLSEITIAARLVHPNLLPVFDSGGDSDCLFYVMPYVEGESLSQRLGREGRLPIDDALRIAREIGEALAYAHAQGVIHRDIKPENILLVQGHAIISDFGIARAIEEAGGERLTMTGLAVGTPLYMSPEQAQGLMDVDARTDVYSLACVLYEMLSGTAPHAADTPGHVIARKFADPPDAVRVSRADVPPAVDRALARALAVDPEDRPRSADEFVAALSAPSLAPAAASLVQPTWIRIAAAAIAVAIVLSGGILALRARTKAGAIAGEHRLGLAVFPFHATVDGGAQWEEAIPDLLTTALDGVPGFSILDPLSLWRPLRPGQQARARSPDANEAANLAQHSGAAFFVLGSITQLQREVQVTIRMYRTGASEPWQTFAVTGSLDSVRKLSRDISLETMRRLAVRMSPNTPARLEQGLTRSPDALKFWLVAREHRRRGQLDSAEAAIDRALALDSTFVLALVDAVVIKAGVQFSRGQPYSDLYALVLRAVHLADSVPERYQLHARAMLAAINTDGASAAAALNKILAIDSTDFDAWSTLAYVQASYGWQYGQTARDAAASADHALRLDSTDATMLARRAYFAFAADDSADIARQAARIRHADTSAVLVHGMLRSIEALAADDAEFGRLAPRLATGSLPDWVMVLRNLRGYRPDRAETLVEQTRREPSQLARFAVGGEVQLLAGEGRWHLLDSLHRSGALPGLGRAVHRMIVAGAVAGAGDDQIARSSVTALSSDLPPDSVLAFFGKRQVAQDGWLIAAYHAMFGDTAVARRWQLALGTLPTKNAHPARSMVALRADIEARMASRRGDRVNAIMYARRAYEAWDIHTENDLELAPEPALRFHFAMLLRLSGARDSAAALFRSFVPPTTWMGFYTARSALELGELSEDAGDRLEAQREFLLARRLWERGDTAVESLRDRARRGVSRLAGEGSRR